MLLLLNQQRSFLSYQRLNCTALETTGAKVAYECKADFGNLLLYENDAYRMVAMHNAPEAYASLRTSTPVIRPSPENALGRVAATKELVQITDLLADDAYKKRVEPDTVCILGGNPSRARTVRHARAIQ